MSVSLLTAMIEVDARPPARTGTVYVLINDDEIIYIGQTTQLQQRLWMHRCGTKHAPAKQFDRVFVINVDIDDLDAYEGALIRRFNPTLSWTARSDESRDVEVLAAMGLSPDPVARDAFFARRRKHWAGAYSERCVREWGKRRWKRVRTSAVLWREALRHLEQEAKAP